MVGSGGGEAPI